MSLSYEVTNWENGKTVLKAEHLRKIEKGITDIISENDAIYKDEDIRKSNEKQRQEEHSRKMNEVSEVVSDIQKDYDSLQKIIIDENASANLQNQINQTNSQLAHNTNNIYYVNPRNFNDNIQDAIEYAYANEIGCVKLEGKKYLLTDSVLVYSNMTLEGVEGKTVLELKGVDKPIISKKGSITGYTHIKNIKVVGDKSLSNNHGIVLNDFYSSITNCEAVTCGGYGFCISEANASSTLVENRIENCIARSCTNTSFHLGNSTNKITDGFLLNCISCGNGSNKALHIGSGAGWNVNGLHTYGHGNSNTVIRVANSYNTFINNIYIEDFLTCAMDLSQCQQGLNISNVTLNFKQGLSNATAIRLNHSTAFNVLSDINISNVSIHNYGGLTNCNIYGGDDSWYTANVTNTSITGENTGLNIIQSGLSNNRFKLISDARVLGKLHLTRDITEDSRNILYNGYKIPIYKSGQVHGNSSEQTITINLPYFWDYDKIIAEFKIYTSSWDVGASRIKYSTELLISAKTGTSAKVYKNDLFTSVGFAVEPSFSIDKTEKALTVKFTPSNADGTGIWICNMYQL